MSGLRRIALFLVLTLLLIGQALDCCRADSWYGDHERGWFWYEDPPDEIVPEEPEELPLEALPQTTIPEPRKPEGPPMLSAEWIRQNLKKYRLLAIDDPTPENVAAYMYIQRVMLDKSQRFAEQVKHVVQLDPYLDQGTRRPIASYGGAQFSREARAATQYLLAQIAKQAGIFFFFQGRCSHCEIQAPVLKSLQDRYDFTIFPVSIDGRPLQNKVFPEYVRDQGQARKLKVIQTPAMFLGRPDTKDIFPLGQSTLSRDQLEKRILVAARDAGWITPEEYNRTQGFNTSLALDLRPDSIPAGISEQELVGYIQKLYAERLANQGIISQGGLAIPVASDNSDAEQCSKCQLRRGY